jgi:peptidyl-prolyl cis-trans isomerase C
MATASPPDFSFAFLCFPLILTTLFNQRRTNHSFNSLIYMKTFKVLSTTALLLSASAFAADIETAPVSEPAATPAAVETVAIRVNDEVITQGDLQEMANTMLQQYQAQAQGAPISDEIKAQALKGAEDNAITEKLIAIAIAGSGIVVSNEEVESTIAQIKTSIPEGLTFEAALASQGMSLEALKENIKTDMAARQLFESQTKDVAEATEADAQAFYDGNPQNFNADENASASHILLTFEQGESDEAKLAKKAQLETIRADIIAETTTFEDAAKAHSGCPSGAQGGSLGQFGKGQMVPEFEIAVFGQDVDAVGEIVETSFGYHIIKVTERQDASATPFAEVKDQIINYLSQNAKGEAAQAYINSLRDAATIEYVKPAAATPEAVDHSGHNH